jgi:cell division protein ZapA (FtsZ GTPase activity inhibitor)
VAALDSLRQQIAELNERERKLLTILGAVFVAILVVLPLYLISTGISDIETENEGIADVLSEIQDARSELAQRDAEREAAMARYGTPTPPLGSFVENEANQQELRLREVTDQPEQVFGEFRRRAVRASMPNVELRPVIKMVTSIENSRYPVAVTRLQIENYRRGQNYNVELSVITFDRAVPNAEGDDADPERHSKQRGRAGPPSPP